MPSVVDLGVLSYDLGDLGDLGFGLVLFVTLGGGWD